MTSGILQKKPFFFAMILQMILPKKKKRDVKRFILQNNFSKGQP